MCQECLHNLVTSYLFISKVKNTNRYLITVLENLSDILSNIDEEILLNKQALYLIADEVDSKAILIPRKEKNLCSTEAFTCFQCCVDFENLQELKDHHILTHGTLMCEKCLKNFEFDDQLQKHMIEAHSKYKCPKCDKYRSSETSLAEHQRKAHGVVFICDICGKIFNQLEKLKLHELTHSSMKCPKCKKTYHTKMFYLKHTKLCLEGKLDPHPFRSKIHQTHICGKCGKSYGTPGGLRVHERFVHGNAIPHICQYCNKSFTAPSYLKMHLVKHTGEKKFKCDICKRNFVTKEALLYHTRRHTGEKPYSCNFCNEKFVNSSSRAEHIKFRHVGPTLMCEICSRKFVTKTFLQKHIAKHYDPCSKLYTRFGPPDVPSVENMRIKVEYQSDDDD